MILNVRNVSLKCLGNNFKCVLFVIFMLLVVCICVRRWEEAKRDDGTKWTFLEHKGPVFAPPYEPLPENVKFYYDGKEIKLSQDAEEVAGFYARMLDHDYTTKEVFNTNFFKDWRKVMTEKEKSKITDLKKCNFKAMHAYFMDLAEKNRNRTKEEKAELKAKNEQIMKEYGYCTIDGHREKIGNFKIEPPGLFRGKLLENSHFVLLFIRNLSAFRSW